MLSIKCLHDKHIIPPDFLGVPGFYPPRLSKLERLRPQYKRIEGER